jgi:hypothetical protein
MEASIYSMKGSIVYQWGFRRAVVDKGGVVEFQWQRSNVWEPVPPEFFVKEAVPDFIAGVKEAFKAETKTASTGEMNTYTFRITTEGIGADESVQVAEVVLHDTTPHEAWATMGKLLSGLEENDRVILRIELV